MKRSFSQALRTLVMAAGFSLALASGMSFAERAPMAPLPSPSGVDIPPASVPANPNALASGTQAQAQPANPSIFTVPNSDPQNYVSIPDKQAGVLIQRSGQAWRVFRNGVITVYGGWLLAIAFFGIIGVYVAKGSIKLHEPLSVAHLGLSLLPDYRRFGRPSQSHLRSRGRHDCWRQYRSFHTNHDHCNCS